MGGGGGGLRSVTAPVLPTLGGNGGDSLSPPLSARPTPSLKLAIPLGSGGGGAAFSDNGYPEDGALLRTPVAGEPGEDRDVTVHARSTAQYLGGGDADFGGVDQMSAMTEDIRAAMLRMTFGPSPTPSNGTPSRSGSASGSGASPAGRGSGDDLSKLQAVSLSGLPSSDGEDSRPSSLLDTGPHLDSNTQITFVKRLGEGSGGAVDLVKTGDGTVLARKVRFFKYFSDHRLLHAQPTHRCIGRFYESLTFSHPHRLPTLSTTLARSWPSATRRSAFSWSFVRPDRSIACWAG